MNNDEFNQKETPAKKKTMRQWLVPRSVLGFTALILSFSIGTAFSGAILYSYYSFQLTKTQKAMDEYVKGFDGRYRSAVDTIDAVAENAKADVQKETESLRKTQAEGGTSSELVKKIGDSVWFVETKGTDGSPSVGSAFVVSSNSGRSIFVTSYETVKASTNSPAPEIKLRNGNQDTKATLVNWDEGRDIAVLTADKGNIKTLPWVNKNAAPRVGDRTFAASGLGGAGASVSQGFVTDSTATALQISAPIGPQFRGGPIVNSNGDVTAIASEKYAPFNFTSSNGVTFGIPITMACDNLLNCPKDKESGGDAKAR